MAEAQVAQARGGAERPAKLQWSKYQIYLVGLLLLVTVSNYLDRIVIGVLQEPIKVDLGLSDKQLGLLSGPAFALFYSVAGIPVARLAERANRARVLAVAIAVWSIMTAACGLARNYVVLLLCRVGVGMGGGGCIPVSHSLLADNFSMRQRGVVMSIVSAAPSIATILAPIIGGLVAEHYGWRTAFIVVGLPGLLLAVLVWFTVREPRTERTVAERPKSNFWADLKQLFSNPTFAFLFIGGAFIGVAYSGLTAFTVSFLMRSHDMALSQAGGVLGLSGLFGLAGTFIGGFVADRYAGKRGLSYLITPAVGGVLTWACYMAAFQLPSWPMAMAALLAAAVAYNLKNGPIYASVQNVAPDHMRATASAIFMFGATVLGSTTGPLVAGIVSDSAASRMFPAALGAFEAACPGGRAPKGAGEPLASACASASAGGLETALLVVACGFLVATVFLVLSALALRKQRAAG
ncbi:MFS transporter [Phenylobacterium sp. J367]|uniref:spinster family MFS transporter n=1 Tax=Phenylobacterium sp. J367 TaxID=2898435 RepID=UPI0021512097|nr:MFS transporter [Phenylobacterium sp. J367]MCR5879815.1 MFS transporter [Phenylobacterium sp. J367]